MSDTFKVDTSTKDKIHIFTTHGYINNLGGEAIAVAYKKAAQENAEIYLFDLADSRIVNSIGVSVLIELLEETIEKKGIMAFCSCAPIVLKTFQIMGISQYAQIFDTLDEALSKLT
jgi:anti-anti-sigma factor